MTLLAALALALVAQEPDTPERTARMAGREVRWKLESRPATEYPDNVLNWDGWGFDFKGPRTVPRPFRRLALPPGLEGSYQTAHAKVTEATPVWRAKFFILSRSDVLEEGADGVFRTQRATIEDFQIDRMLRSIARFGAMVEVATDGAVRLEPELEIDSEPARFTVRRSPAAGGEAPFGEEFLRAYVAPRVNGPGFEPEDRKYRGPYSSVFVIHAGLDGPPEAPRAMVNGTPASALAVYRDPSVPEPGALDQALLDQWRLHAGMRAVAWGRPAREPVPASLWPLLARADDLTVDQHAALVTGASDPAAASGSLSTVLEPAAIAPNVTLELEQDPERGDVLLYAEHGETRKENSMARQGGAAAPSSADGPLIAASSAATLSFFAKSVSKDPLAVKLWSAQKLVAEIVLGPVNPAPPERSGDAQPAVLPTSFRADGAWHRVAVSLAGLGPAPITSLTLGPPVAASRYDKATLGAIEFRLDDFRTSAEPPEGAPSGPVRPDLSSTDEAARVMALGTLSTDSASEQLETAMRLIKDPTEFVALNAVGVFTRVKRAEAEPALASAGSSVSPRVAQLAVRALAFQDTESAWDAVRRALERGTVDLARQEAAERLAERKDPNLAGPISVLVASKSRGTRLGAARAIGRLPGEKAQMVLLAFLGQEDPSIRLAVVSGADVGVPQMRRALLYTAVNDPSDEVRLRCYERLLTSQDQATRAEAIKGVRDDGLLVRLGLLQHFQERPSEEQRAALRQAVVDPSPRVRAAALGAFAKLPKPVELAEVENTLGDAHPLVQEALIALASAKDLRLPAETVQALRQSRVPEVAAKARALWP